MIDTSVDEAESRATVAWAKGLMPDLLAKAAREFGPGSMNGWTLVGFGVRDDGAGLVVLSAEARTFALALNRTSLGDRRALLYDLAHELTHVLEAGPDGTAPMLEEGCCVWFSLYGPEYPDPSDVEMLRALTFSMPSSQNYALALLSVEDLLALDPEAVRKLRAREPEWIRITPGMILDVVPSCPPWLAFLLCETRDMHDVTAWEAEPAPLAEREGRV